jgi:transposase InsO family protein
MTFVCEHRDRYAVALLLRVLDVKPQTYYGWVKRAAQPAERDEVDLGLLSVIHEIWTASGATYGAPRVHQILRRRGISVSRKRVERLMRAHGFAGAFLRRGWRGATTKQNPRHTAAPDLVDRNFTAAAPNRLWVADATRLLTGEGVLWLACVRDAFSRRIVGWKTSDRCDTDLVTAALDYAAWSRDIRDGELIHHSDKGSTYTAIRFTDRLSDNGIRASTGSVGDSFDNALAENFFSTFKIELYYRTSWRTRSEADNAIFQYIDGWYNPTRIQAELGWLSPDEYETAWHTAQTHQPEPATIQPAPTGAR